MSPQNIRRSARFGEPQSYTRCIQFGFVEIGGAVDSFLLPLGNGLLHLSCLRLVLLQAREARLPLAEFSVAHRHVLNHSVSLIFVLKLGSLPLRLRGIFE